MENESVVVSTRIPSNLKKIIEKYLEKDTHLNESDLLRDALREKLKRDAPELFAEVFQVEA